MRKTPWFLPLLLTAALLTAMLPTVPAAAMQMADTWDGSIDVNWYSAGGTNFWIFTSEELAGLAQIVNDGLDSFSGDTITLATDLDLNGLPWTPIGKGSAIMAPYFGGTFEGGGHTISNLAIGTPSSPDGRYIYAGLFGYIYGGTIKDLGLENVYVNISFGNAGGLAGVTNGITGGMTTIQDCYATGFVSINGLSGALATAGGLVGDCYYCNMERCYTAGSIRGESDVCAGGLVGYAEPTSSITGCYSTVSVTSVSGVYACAGGLIGYSDGAAINTCYATGNVSCTSIMQMGLVIGGRNSGFYSTCYYNKSATMSAGGIVLPAKGIGDGGVETVPRTSAEMQGFPFMMELNVFYPYWSADMSLVNQGYPVLTTTGTSAPVLNRVTYNANGATGGALPTDTGAYPAGVTAVVAANTESLARTNYSFAGWNTQSNGGGTGYSPGYSYVVAGDATLYARWIPNFVPTVLPTNGSFTDTDDQDTGEIAGTIAWTPANPATDIDGYNIYWGSGTSEKLAGYGDPVYTAEGASAASQTVDADTALPSGASYFLIYSYNAAGDSAGCLAIDILDLPEALSGTASITGSAVYGQVLTASLTGGNNTGTLSYQWTRDTADITGANDSTYTLAADDIGAVIAVKVTSSVETGTLTSEPTAAVEKADCEVSTVLSPELESSTTASITLKAVTGYEYILVANGADVSTGAWQDSNMFTGLAVYTNYDAYQRVKGTATHKPSAVSAKLDVSTNPDALTGTATITGSAVYGETLTASLVSGNNTGTLSYQWTRDTADITGANDSTYTLAADDISAVIAVKIASSVETGTLTSEPTAAVEKADCEVTPVLSPELESSAAASITLKAVTGYEYILVANGADASTGAWQDSNAFTGLAAYTDYDAYQRVKGTATHKPSAVSAKLDVSTDPDALTGTATITGSAVYGETLTASLVSGNNTGTLSYQWTRDTVDISGADDSTYILVEDDIGAVIAVKITSSVETGTLTSEPTAAVEKADCEVSPVLSPELESSTTASITLKAVTGYEYILVANGADASTGAWQDSNTFVGLAAYTNYDTYQRVKETATCKPSALSVKLSVKTADNLASGTLQWPVQDAVISAQGQFSRDASLTITELSPSDADWIALAAYLSGKEAIAAYEVSIAPVDAYALPVALSFQVDAKYNGLEILVLHKLAGGGVESFTPTVQNGWAAISVTAFSPFLLAAEQGVKITLQPQNATVAVGDKAVFQVEATGFDLAYNWQQSTDGGTLWQGITGVEGSSYTTSPVKKANDGYLYRVTVKDGYGDTETSRSALLTVTSAPDTGDGSRPWLYGGAAALLTALAALLLRRRKKA